MTGSAGLGPLLFVIVIVFVLVWQALGNIGAEYYLLHWIGMPWHNPPATLKPVEADTTQALMVWADEGGAGENAAWE